MAHLKMQGIVKRRGKSQRPLYIICTRQIEGKRRMTTILSGFGKTVHILHQCFTPSQKCEGLLYVKFSLFIYMLQFLFSLNLLAMLSVFAMFSALMLGS